MVPYLCLGDGTDQLMGRCAFAPTTDVSRLLQQKLWLN